MILSPGGQVYIKRNNDQKVFGKNTIRKTAEGLMPHSVT